MCKTFRCVTAVCGVGKSTFGFLEIMDDANMDDAAMGYVCEFFLVPTGCLTILVVSAFAFGVFVAVVFECVLIHNDWDALPMMELTESSTILILRGPQSSS